MIQYDWSYHYRFEKRLDEEFCLLVGIDDATGRLMQLRLWDNEWYQSTIEYWVCYMRKYWVPECIYVDRFATYKVNHKKATDDTKLVTKFEKALQKLWCLLIKANSPQAKWRVERVNRTLQDRLVKAMRLANINDVASANEWMNNEFIPKFNKRLGKPAQREWDKHRPLTQEENDDLMRIFATESARVVANDFVITYQNRTFQLLPEWRGSVTQKSSILVLETIYGEIQFIANKKPIPYSEIDPEKVKQGRAKTYLLAKAKKEKEDKERIQANAIKRAEERHKISKQKQAKWRTERIIAKAKQSRQE